MSDTKFKPGDVIFAKSFIGFDYHRDMIGEIIGSVASQYLIRSGAGEEKFFAIYVADTMCFKLINDDKIWQDILNES
jgi:hypothetical protein